MNQTEGKRVWIVTILDQLAESVERCLYVGSEPSARNFLKHLACEKKAEIESKGGWHDGDGHVEQEESHYSWGCIQNLVIREKGCWTWHITYILYKGNVQTYTKQTEDKAIKNL